MKGLIARLGIAAPLTTAVTLAAFAFGASPAAFAATNTVYKWSGGAASTAGQNGCSSNCWSVPGNWQVSTDGGATFTTATSAPSSAANSGTGDDFIFDNHTLSASTSMTNDLANLVVNTITVKDSGSTQSGYGYTLSGQAFTLTTGLVAGTAYLNNRMTINNAITIGASMPWGSTDNTQTYNYSVTGTVTIPQGVTLTYNQSHPSLSNIAGAGTFVLASPVPSSNTPNPYTNSLYLYGANSFSGAFDLKSGSALSVDGPAAIGTAAVTVEKGAQFQVQDNPQPAKASDTLTFANTFHLAGTGDSTFDGDQGVILAGMYDGVNKKAEAGALELDFTGTVTLDDDISLASYYDTVTTYNFKGTYNQNGHNISVVSRVQPTYGNTIYQVNGTTVIDGTKSQTTAAAAAKGPGTPDTGFSMSGSHPIVTLIVAAASAATIGAVAFKFRKAPAVARARR